MNPGQVVQNLLVDLNNNEVQRAVGYLADNLTFRSGHVQAGKHEFVKVLSAMGSTQPPIEWFLLNFNADGHQVRVKLEPATSERGTLVKPGMKLGSPGEPAFDKEISDWLFNSTGGK